MKTDLLQGNFHNRKDMEDSRIHVYKETMLLNTL